MKRVRRAGVVAVLCVLLLTVGSVAGAAQRSTPPAASQSPVDGTEVDAGSQAATACFDGAGTEFFIGPSDGTHIWVRLHVGMFTDSGWAIGGEMIGATGGNSIIEIIVGLQFVGDGFMDFLSNPVETVELVSGFDFQLPMLEMMTGEFTESDQGGTNDSSAAGDGDHEVRPSDSRFEMLRC